MPTSTSQLTLIDAIQDVFLQDPKSRLHFSEVIKRIRHQHGSRWKANRGRDTQFPIS